MRNVIFRGKSKNDNAWVNNGYIYNLWGKVYLLYGITRAMEMIEVNPETVGQYSELQDKNQKDIFEGDIVRDTEDNCIGVVKFGVYQNSFRSDDLGGYLGFYIQWKEKIEMRRKDIMFWIDKVEVIGNIVDNPDLLDVENGGMTR